MSRQDHGSRWAPGAFIFVLVMCLVYTTGALKKSDERTRLVQSELATNRNLVEQMTTSAALTERAHAAEVAELRAIVVDRNAEIEDLEENRPKTHIREERETPVFAHEWTYPEHGR